MAGYNNAGCRRVGYVTNWSQYRPAPGNFYPEHIDPHLCTHICYAFADLVGNHLKTREHNEDTTPSEKGMFERTMALKRENPSLKILISVGGWNTGSQPFTTMTASSSSRKDFINQSIKWMRKRGFDGLDIDWEYPSAADKNNFTALVRECHFAFNDEARRTGKPRLLLASAVAAGIDKIDAGYDIPEISKYFDFITIMTYDFNGAWANTLGHNSPLYAHSDERGSQRSFNVKAAAEYWVSKGAPKYKLNIGLATYGRGFTLSNKARYQPGDPASGPSRAGVYTRESGFLSYVEVCTLRKNGGTTHRIEEQKVPFVVNGDQWVGYDDARSLTRKTNWVKANGYGGITVWTLDLDDFNGDLGKGKYPLVKTIVKTLAE